MFTNKVKQAAIEMKKFWQDDTGLDDHVSKLLYAAMGFVVGGLIITSVGLALRNKGVSLGNDINSFKATVNTTNAAVQNNTVGFGSGNTTVTNVNVE
jgi:hypothetical protein